MILPDATMSRDYLSEHLLINRGANLCARNYAGEMPFHVAKREHASDLMTVLKMYMNLLNDPFPPLPGSPHSERIRIHPARQEAVTILHYGGLARWALQGKPFLLARVQTTLPHFRHLAVSPDGKQIAIIYADTVELRQWEDLTLVSQIALEDNINCGDIAFSPDGRWLAFNVGREKIYLIERATGKIVLQIDELGRASSLSFDETSRLLACAGYLHGKRIGVYYLNEDMQQAEHLWNDDDIYDNEDEEQLWQPAFIVHAAISPNSQWIAYFGTEEYTFPEYLGVVAVHSLETGKVQWHSEITPEIVGEDHLIPIDYFDQRNHTEVLFVSETELVCGVTAGTLLFFDVATGMLLRRHYFDTDADVLSLALDHTSLTLWAVLNNGELISVRLPITESSM